MNKILNCSFFCGSRKTIFHKLSSLPLLVEIKLFTKKNMVCLVKFAIRCFVKLGLTIKRDYLVGVGTRRSLDIDSGRLPPSPSFNGQTTKMYFRVDCPFVG